MELFKLFGSIMVDNSKANESIQKTDGNASSLGDKFVKGVGTAAKWGAAIGTAAIGAGAAMFGVAKKAAGATDEIDKMSQKLGISRTAYQELDFVMSQSGMEITSFQGGMKTLLKNMDAVTEGNKTATSNFKKLGIQVTDSSGKMKSQEQVLKESISAFQGMADGAEKSRLATELFGKQGQELMPLLNGQSGSFEELTKKAHDLGIVLNDDAVNAGVNFTDSLDQVERSFSSICTQVGVSVMPILMSLFAFITDNMGTIKIVFSTVFSVFSLIVSNTVTIISQFVSNVVGFINSLNVDWTSVFNNIKQVVMFVFNEIVSIWNTILLPAFQMIGHYIQNVLWPVWKWIFDLLAPIVMSCFQGIANLWTNTLKPILVGIINFLDGIFTLDFKKIFSGIVSIVKGIWNGIKSVLWSPIEWVINKVSSVYDFLTSPFRKAADAIGNAWKSIKSLFKLPHLTMKGSWNPLDWISGGLPSIGVEWYAKGGIMNGATPFGFNSASGKMMVGGEKEPEAIAPLSKLEDYYRKWSSEGNVEMLSVLKEIRDYISDEDRWYKIFLKALGDGSFSIVLDGREVGRIVRKYA